MLRTLPISMVGWLIVAAGMFFTLNPDTEQLGAIISFCGIIIFLITFAIGMSSTPWTVNTEIYPLHVVGTATTLSTTTNWVSNFAVASVFLLMLDTDTGKVIAFLLLAFFCGAAWISIYSYLPETANKPID